MTRLLTFAASLSAIVLLPALATGATAKVSLGATPLLVKYGQQTALSGAVSTQKPNQKVALQSNDCTSTSTGFTTTAILTTGSGGTFATTQTPLYNTAYQAVWRKTATSNQVVIQVQPLVKFRKLSAHRYRVRVRTAVNLQHHFIVFQRKHSGHWVTLKRMRLLAITRMGPSQETFVSGKTFRSHVRSGAHIRMLMRAKWTGSCYTTGKSRVIRS
jgi:hypothetical protein